MRSKQSSVLHHLPECIACCTVCLKHSTLPTPRLPGTLLQALCATSLLAQVQEASEALEHAINKSHGSHTEGVVRAVAVACVYRGLQPLSNGYVMKPVAYSVVSNFLRSDCPDLTFVNDWDENRVQTANDCDNNAMTAAVTATAMVNMTETAIIVATMLATVVRHHAH